MDETPEKDKKSNGNGLVSKIAFGVLASLCSYLFYGYINTANEVNSMNTRLLQAESELNDLWSKYNAEIEDLAGYKVKIAEEKAAEAEKEGEQRVETEKRIGEIEKQVVVNKTKIEYLEK